MNKPIDPEIVKLIDSEGDFDEWIDNKTGYKCRINRLKPYDQWNGYVRLPDTSTIGSNGYYDDIDVNVHGGVTWFGKFPVPKLDDNGIWIGFDCGHAWDWVPWLGHRFSENSIYRTKDYVKKECESLAKQLKEMEGC